MSQIKKGAVLSYVNILLTNVVGLVLTPFIVRSLGDSEYGLYTLIGAFVGYIAVMDLGLNNTVVRYVSRYRSLGDKEGEERFLGTVMIIYTFISLIVITIGVFLYMNLDYFFGNTLIPEEMEKAKFMSVILIFNLAFSLPGGAFTAISNSYEKFVFPRALANIKYIVRSLLVVALLFVGTDSIGLVIIDTIVNLGSILVSFIYVKRNLKVRFNFNLPEKKLVYEIFSYSIWIFVFAIIGQMQWKGGQFVIGTSLGTREVAVYAIGILLGSYYGAFSSAISNLFLPRATQMVVQGATSKELTDLFLRVGRFSLLSLILIFVLFVSLGKEFITLWVGENYLDAYYVAIVVMIGYTIPLIQVFANSILEAKKMFKFKTIVYFVFLSLGTLGSFFLVDKYGIVFVIISIVFSWMLSQGVMNYFFKTKLNLDVVYFFREILKSFGISFLVLLIIGFAISMLPILGWIGLVIKASLISSLCCLLLYKFVMNFEEKNMVSGLLSKFKWN